MFRNIDLLDQIVNDVQVYYIMCEVYEVKQIKFEPHIHDCMNYNLPQYLTRFQRGILLYINEENDMHLCNKVKSLKIVVKKQKDVVMSMRENNKCTKTNVIPT